ncbi:PrpF domain-containing protein [Cryptosporangium arvum]|uniref:PrpF domain-containing protein n=1 Tax=Cryptosporangium arvum TaxID=80871 RepID=UPI0004AE77CC|nr:PrpF domain-containing protein [Cryptosporangium arvum]
MSGTDGIPFLLLRGGTSKGVYFLADDLPADPGTRDDLLVRLFGSPDERQVDGLGGGHPLTSKAAVVSRSTDDPGADVDYLFLQVVPDRAAVSARQPCGNVLAGVAPFAIERGLVAAGPETTTVRIRMVNTGGLAVATVPTPGGRVRYAGDVEVAGVPFPAAGVTLRFADAPGPLLPTGQERDVLDGVPVTLVNNGMPVVVVPADALGLDGDEAPSELERDSTLRRSLERLRTRAGLRMGLGDVTAATVPKLVLVSPPRAGGTLTTRTFIPHRVHPAIGVLMGLSVAAAVRMPGSVAADAAGPVSGGRVRLEHPTGTFEAVSTPDGLAVVSSARKIADGIAWPREA